MNLGVPKPVTLITGLSVILSLWGVNSASAATLTYDEIGVPNSVYPYYTGEGFITQGFQFSPNMDVIDISSNSPWKFTGPAVSGNYAALNDYGGSATLTKVGGEIFSFQETYIKSWWNGNISGSIDGYLKNTLVGSMPFANISEWTRVVSNFSKVDKVVVNTTDVFLLDNTQVDNNAASVPEPTVSLGLAAVGLGLALKRKLSSTTV